MEFCQLKLDAADPISRSQGCHKVSHLQLKMWKTIPGFIQSPRNLEKCLENNYGLSRAKKKVLSHRTWKSLEIFQESMNLHNS